MNYILIKNKYLPYYNAMRVPEGDLHCQCVLSIFPPGAHQFYANIYTFIAIWETRRDLIDY